MQSDEYSEIVSDAEAGVVADLHDDRARRMTPALKKAIAYKRDRRFVAEYPHFERKAWPQKKKLRKQTYRRHVDAALRPVLGAVTPDIEDFAPAFPRQPRSPSRHMHGNIPLGHAVHQTLEKRISFVGSNVASKGNQDRYRRRLIPFLESIVVDRGPDTVELARALRSLLNRATSPKFGWRFGWMVSEARSREVRLASEYGWYASLTRLFTERPEWEGRLRTWIDAVAPTETAPTVEMPAWQRIRRRKRQAGR